MTSPLHAHLRKHISNRQTRRVRSMCLSLLSLLSLSQTHANTHTRYGSHTVAHFPHFIHSAFAITPFRIFLSFPALVYSSSLLSVNTARCYLCYAAARLSIPVKCAKTGLRTNTGQATFWRNPISIDLILINDLSCTDFTVMCFG